jgi:hypothetical protein
MANNLSAEQKLLLAAFDLQRTKKTFSAEELVMAAWSRFPDTFGLQGFESKHPDSNKVLWRIMGKKGLRATGWLQKVREKTYRLTEAGRITATELTRNGLDSDGRAGDFSRHAREILARLLASSALAKVKEGKVELLAFRDAEEFWNISTRTNANTLTSRLADVETVLTSADQMIAKTGKSLSLQNGSAQVGRPEIRDLRKTHEVLQAQFKTNLDYIWEFRSDERRR